MQQSFVVEYDFKILELNLIKNSRLNRKYNCLPYMITLPLSRPLYDPGPPVQPDPIYNQTIVKSTSSTTQGWLNFIPIYNPQLNIITIDNNTLVINKYSYNYDIVVNVIRKGDTDVPLRFMVQNPFSLLASNMNDIYGDETVFKTRDGKQIKFTITGQYQFFYINYPTTNFKLDISITTSTKKVPILVCYNNINDSIINNINNINNNHFNNFNNINYNINNKDKCNKDKCNKNNCTCFDINGNGYLRVENHGEIVNVPVYTSRIIGNTIYDYLYPEFGYLRDLFYNITLANSLPVPENFATKNLITTTIRATTAASIGATTAAFITDPALVGKSTNRLIIAQNLPTTITVSVNEQSNCGPLWGLYVLSGPLVIPGRTFGCNNPDFFNYIKEPRTSGFKYRYSWNTTPFLFTTSLSIGLVGVSMVPVLSFTGPWEDQLTTFVLEAVQSGDVYNYRLPAGHYDNMTKYQNIAFRFRFAGQELTVIPTITFDMSVTEVPN